VKLFVALTGASGAIYAQRALQGLAAAGVELGATASPTGRQIVRAELGCEPEELSAGATWFAPDDLRAPFASGSAAWDGALIVPCSMGTIGRIAAGTSETLITRAADVCLKERRPLVVVPREAPVSVVHLRNMLALAEAGAVILPAAPPFYGLPASIEDLVDALVGRILTHLGVPHRLGPVWGERS